MAYDIVHVGLLAGIFFQLLLNFKYSTHRTHCFLFVCLFFFPTINSTEAWEERTLHNSQEAVVHYIFALPISYSGCFSEAFEL